MSKKKKNGQPVVTKRRSAEAIKRGLTRKVKNMVRSNGSKFALDWLKAQPASKTFGKTKVILPLQEWRKLATK